MFKARMQSYWPLKVNNGKHTFTFTIFPEISIFWFGRLQNTYFTWLFWELNIMIYPNGKNSNT